MISWMKQCRYCSCLICREENGAQSASELDESRHQTHLLVARVGIAGNQLLALLPQLVLHLWPTRQLPNRPRSRARSRLVAGACNEQQSVPAHRHALMLTDLGM